MPVSRNGLISVGQLAANVRGGAAGGAWRATGVIAESVPRWAPFTATSGLTSGTMRLSGPMLVPANTTVTNVSVFSGTTALSVGSNQWFAIFNSSLNKLAITTDDTSTAWAATTKKTLALSATWTPVVDTVVTVGVLVVATTPPTLMTITAGSWPQILEAPNLSGTSNAALTNPASCPSTATAPASGASPFFCYLS